jgi:hydrogenase expression/formation protein HypC
VCVAIPAKIVELLDNQMAKVDFSGNLREVSVALLESPQAGDYVLVHAGYAIETVDEDTALQIKKDIESIL